MKMVEKLDSGSFTMYDLARELDRMSKRISDTNNRIRKIEHRITTIENQLLQRCKNTLFRDVQYLKNDVRQLKMATGLEKPLEGFMNKLIDSFTYHDNDSIWKKEGEKHELD